MEETIIYLDIEEEDMYSGIDAISFVDSPAIEMEWEAFSKPKQKFETNNEKQIVTSPVMLAETPIYRHSEELGDYYVKFSADTIFKMRNKYIMDGRQHEVNLDHDSKRPVKDVYMVESFIVGDKVESKLFSDLPQGTWVASFYIPDKEKWDKIVKGGEFKGFSLEGFFIESYEMRKVQENYKAVKEILESEKHDLVKEALIKKVLGVK
jgi:hypothetical protein